MVLRILSYVVTAIAPVAIFLVSRWIAGRGRGRRLVDEFWSRQNPVALEKVAVAGMKMPAPLKVVEHRWVLERTLRVIATAVEHGVLTFIDENPSSSAEQIGNFLGFSARQVESAIEVLVSAEVLERTGSGYSVSQAARVYLFKESPFYSAVALPPPLISKSALKIFRTGVVPGPVAKWATGKSNHPREWAAVMHRMSFPLGFALHETGVLGTAKHVLDVAGGAASVCVALALRDPSKTHTVIELPGSVSTASAMISQYGVSDRVKCIGMDMFSGDWPQTDAVLFTNIFHDWDEERCATLAKKAFDSLAKGGIVVLQEALLHDEEPGPLWTADFSLQMAIRMQGRQFRPRDLLGLLERAGFAELRALPLLGYYSAVVGVRPS